MTSEERTSCARNAATGTLRKRGELRTTAAARSLRTLSKHNVGHAAHVVGNNHDKEYMNF